MALESSARRRADARPDFAGIGRWSWKDGGGIEASAVRKRSGSRAGADRSRPAASRVLGDGPALESAATIAESLVRRVE